MRRGPAAALYVLTVSLAWPAHAEPEARSFAPAAAAAAAAAQATKPAPPKPADPAPAQQAAAPPPNAPSAPPAPNSPAPATSQEDEAPAEPGASPDAPPAQQGAAPATGDAPPAKSETETAKPAADDAAPAAASAEEKANPDAAEAVKAPDPTKPKPIAAKTLFGAVKDAAPLATRSIGTYARGCLAGAQPFPVDGPQWQAMRLSRNRTWGHPDLVALIERFAGEVKQDGWPGLLVGDISQPRGGPMLTGHASHQVGLDADIWFTPMPDHRLSNKDRETLAATSMLADDSLSVNPKVWSESRVKIIKRMASYAKVERVLVHPAIKKALCQAAGTDRNWLKKVRPYWGHFYHFHVRIGCPSGSAGCKPQAPVPGDDGCGKELDDWFKLLTRKPKAKPAEEPKVVVKPSTPRRAITLDDLPAECRVVLATGRDIKLPPPAVAAKAAKSKSAAKSSAKGEKHVTKPAEKKAGPTKAAAAKSAEKTDKE